MPSNTKQVDTCYFHGKDLTPAQLLDMSNLRRFVMNMKPDTDLAQDFVKFCEFCQSCFMVALFRDPADKLVGTLCYAMQRGRAASGPAYLLIISDFTFMLPQYRAHPCLAKAITRMTLKVATMWRGEQIWFGGIGYPAVMLVYETMFRDVYLSGDSNLPPVAQTLLALVEQQVAGSRWQVQSGCANMPTTPPVMSAQWQANVAERDLYRRYVANCPDWKFGYALAGVARMNPLLMLWASVLKQWRRVVRRK
jgi:hypothetical protein